FYSYKQFIIGTLVIQKIYRQKLQIVYVRMKANVYFFMRFHMLDLEERSVLWTYVGKLIESTAYFV
ncbi:hypothetical protein, partial [Bacillus safensis]|uniref:hypothetical protein n=1 Tax=Bacillus safensis TaxID=561879 RepID=UPI002FFD5A3C